MHRFTSFVALALFCFAARSTAPPALLANEGPVLLSTKQARLLFKQCSRQAPQFDGTPQRASRPNIDKLERALPEFLKERQAKRLRIPEPNQAYRGQYAEFKRNGVTYIYGSYFPADDVRDTPLDGKALIWCDGGASFWGVVFEPATGQFTQFEVNGAL